MLTSDTRRLIIQQISTTKRHLVFSFYTASRFTVFVLVLLYLYLLYCFCTCFTVFVLVLLYLYLFYCICTCFTVFVLVLLFFLVTLTVLGVNNETQKYRN